MLYQLRAERGDHSTEKKNISYLTYYSQYINTQQWVKVRKNVQFLLGFASKQAKIDVFLKKKKKFNEKVHLGPPTVDVSLCYFYCTIIRILEHCVLSLYTGIRADHINAKSRIFYSSSRLLRLLLEKLSIVSQDLNLLQTGFKCSNTFLSLLVINLN